MPDAKWIVAQTHPRKERVALDNLARQSFVAYSPMLQVTIRHARRVQRALKPLFPGYVFAAVDCERQAWRPMLSTIGIRSVVLAGGRPGQLPAGFVEALKARELDGAIVHPSTPYDLGQKVWICDGAFDGLVATIAGLDDRTRPVVLIELLNRPIRVQLDAARLRDVRG